MPRSAEEKKRNARKYGRRHALLKAEHSAKELDAMAQKLLRDLKRAGADAETVARLAKDLERFTDVKRHRSAVWAIADALEKIEERER